MSTKFWFWRFFVKFNFVFLRNFHGNLLAFHFTKIIENAKINRENICLNWGRRNRHENFVIWQKKISINLVNYFWILVHKFRRILFSVSRLYSLGLYTFSYRPWSLTPHEKTQFLDRRNLHKSFTPGWKMAQDEEATPLLSSTDQGKPRPK